MARILNPSEVHRSVRPICVFSFMLLCFDRVGLGRKIEDFAGFRLRCSVSTAVAKLSTTGRSWPRPEA